MLAAPMDMCEQQGVACDAYAGSGSGQTQQSSMSAKPAGASAHEVRLCVKAQVLTISWCPKTGLMQIPWYSCDSLQHGQVNSFIAMESQG